MNPARDLPPAKSLPDLMARRLDAYLPTLQSNTARRVFLTAQLASFKRQAREVLFGKTAPPYEPGFGYPSATDYHLTVLEIAARLDALSAMEDA